MSNIENEFEKIYNDLKMFYDKIADKSLELKNNKKYWSVIKKYYEICEKFEDGLNQEQQDLFSDLCDLNADMEDAHGFSMFKEGFKIGFIMALQTDY